MISIATKQELRCSTVGCRWESKIKTPKFFKFEKFLRANYWLSAAPHLKNNIKFEIYDPKNIKSSIFNTIMHCQLPNLNTEGVSRLNAVFISQHTLEICSIWSKLIFRHKGWLPKIKYRLEIIENPLTLTCYHEIKFSWLLSFLYISNSCEIKMN